jgi:hypothetical protein
LKKSNLLVGLFTILALTGCDQNQLNLKVEKFDDTITSHTYTKHYGTCQGWKAIYCVYGKTPSGIPAGVAVTFDHKFFFSIKELTDKNPELLTQAVSKAEEVQEKLVR